MVKKSFFPLLEEDFAVPFELLDEREELDELTLELDFTELLDLAEDELFFDEDETLLQDEGLDPSWLSPLRMTLSLLSLLLRMTPEDESSPQAVNKNVNASAKTRVMDPRPLAKDDWPRVTGKDDVNNSFFILDKFAMTCFITTPKRLS
jgi:hypothetical protein